MMRAMLLLTLLAAAQLADAAPPPARFSGTCIYPPALLERAAPGELVLCDEAEVTDNSVGFGQSSWGVQVRFWGAWDGDRLTVSRVSLRGGTVIAVRGLCRVERAEDRVSTIACTAVADDGNGSIAANFVRGF